DLKAGDDFMNTRDPKKRDALKDLASRGFTPLRKTQGGPLEIISSDGEVIATMKNGTEYVLRFGKMTDTGSHPEDEHSKEGEKHKPAAEEKKPADEKKKQDAAAEKSKAADAAKKADAEKKNATDKKDEKKDVEKIIAERKAIEAENQRKLDEYNESLKKGREN